MTKRSMELLLAEIRKLASTGITIAQAADKLGYTYQYVCKIARDNDVNFTRPDTSPDEHRPRNQEICKRYLAGEMQADIARDFGMTRERVRQIIEKAGLVSETQRHAEFVAVVAGTVSRKKLTLAQASEMFKINYASAYNYCKQHGVKPSSMTVEEEEELESLAAKVVNGLSCRKAAGGPAYKAEKLRRHLIRKGISSRGRSKHDDFSERKKLIENWRADGLTWEECASRLSEHDGRAISGGGVYLWCKRHMTHLFQSAAA